MNATKPANRAFVVAMLLLALLPAGLALYRYNAGALWRIVHRQCQPGYLRSGNPAPCRVLDPVQGYALLQDRKGGVHELLIPTRRITGIESRVLQKPETPNYFWLAWQARGVLSSVAARPVPDAAVAIAVNSQYGRSQNQLHLHLSCLRPDIRQQLALARSRWSTRWSRYGLLGHNYYLRTLTEAELAEQSLFVRVAKELPDRGQARGRYGIALAQLQDGRFVLLVLPRNLLGRGANLGSPAELQDDSCATAGTGSFPMSWYSRALRPRDRSAADDGERAAAPPAWSAEPLPTVTAGPTLRLAIGSGRSASPC
ncbi:CDP-diacylglycerol pyrophosphatase [Xanthomonas translucens pv. arrhenatheri]|uniref:CDP-diacylglycerol pyrophosphatase n=1 Tax=Xanthomonas graminis pv. arrhenatheri LMG 727 TaxID=1195923 RepID=A0A0K2ZFJ7_9XANT|nr:CDP-diacylglycerol diphosphatase [Xanthomonas translucens]OAX65216.1 CDP-diacylglycerol pyrophosphatase [Xanthomonas translucens pv. arrhenatheri]UKE76143.1 CDP-diacylglycerol diphosphatase [Xanthomonas translucens pv. arrhenatheri]CTP84398.1 cdp-diacylglycerol phosphotidylhydrolase [Xanthomonas translucens pv. arrhenatheri LMG 727]